MKFKIHVKDDSSIWWEDYEKDIPDAHQWAADTIDRFNNSLKPGEKQRELLEVKIIDSDNEKFHRWVKRTDGMSVAFRGSTVDIMFCERCGITGKRYGLWGEVKIDSKYRKKAYRQCDTSLIKQGRD